MYQLTVWTLLREKVFMITDFYNFSMIQHDNLIRKPNGRQPMSN